MNTDRIEQNKNNVKRNLPPSRETHRVIFAAALLVCDRLTPHHIKPHPREMQVQVSHLLVPAADRDACLVDRDELALHRVSAVVVGGEGGAVAGVAAAF